MPLNNLTTAYIPTVVKSLLPNPSSRTGVTKSQGKAAAPAVGCVTLFVEPKSEKGRLGWQDPRRLWCAF